MSYSTLDASIINNPNHIVKYKLELLDEYLIPESELTSDAQNVTFEIDASSDIRRTSTLTMNVTDESWLTDNFEIGWINKLVRFSIGLRYTENGVNAWRWYVLGTMLLSSDTFNYDASTRELQLSLVDLMAYGTSERGSQIGHVVILEYESNIKKLLEKSVERWLPYKQTDIAEFPDVLPYELEFNLGSYPFEIMKTIVGLFPWYEQYYDAAGVYHVQKIPMRVDEPCQLYEADIDDLIISERRSFDYSQIKNTTEIYGKLIRADYTATESVLTGDTYTLRFVLLNMEALENNKKYCFKPDADSPANPKIHIELTDEESQDTAEIVDSNGDALEAGALRAGYSYVVRCLDVPEEQEGATVLVKKFFLIGQKQIHVIVREMNVMPDAETIEQDKRRNDCMDIRYIINPDSPYACDRWNNSSNVPVRMSIVKGEIRQVLYDGDYAAIYSTDLAYQRGGYENYLRCRMNTEIELKTVLIPFIDVNQKIQYTSPITGEVHQYIVKSVDMDVSAFTMTLRLARFYNYYPDPDLAEQEPEENP